VNDEIVVIFFTFFGVLLGA